MYLISLEGYTNAGVHILTLKKTGKTWASMKNVHDSLGVKNMPDLISKEIYGRYWTGNLTKELIRRYKMTEKEIKYENLSQNELIKISNKEAFCNKKLQRQKNHNWT